MTDSTLAQDRKKPPLKWGAALSCLITSAMLFITWWNPMLLQEGRWVGWAGPLFFFEFLGFHSGIFIGLVFSQKGSLQAQKSKMLPFLLFYAIFALILAFASGDWLLLVLFAVLTISRIYGGVRDKTGQYASVLAARSYAALPCILVAFIGMALSSQLLTLGLTSELLREIKTTHNFRFVSGSYVVLGAIYFLAMGFVELFIERLFKHFKEQG